MRQFLLVLGLGLLGATPVWAQWQFRESEGRVEASVFAADGARLVLACEDGPLARNHVQFELALRENNRGDALDSVVVLRTGRSVISLDMRSVAIQTPGMNRYEGLYDFQSNAGTRSALKSGSSARVDGSLYYAGTTFSLSGSRDSITRLEYRCPWIWSGQQAPVPPPGPRPLTGALAPQGATPFAPGRVPPPPPLASLIPDEALSGLQSYVRDQIAPNCAPSVPVSLNEATMFQVSGADVTVWLNQAQCAWTTVNNPYCANGRCTVWVYRYTGGQFQLLRTGTQ